jgi:hypothetical protein
MKKSTVFVACDVCETDLSGDSLFVVTYNNTNSEFCVNCLDEFTRNLKEGDIITVKLEFAPYSYTM